MKVILSHSHRRREKGHLECEKNETWNPFYHFRISSCECYFLTHDSTPSKTPKKKAGLELHTKKRTHCVLLRRVEIPVPFVVVALFGAARGGGPTTVVLKREKEQ